MLLNSSRILAKFQKLFLNCYCVKNSILQGLTTILFYTSNTLPSLDFCTELLAFKVISSILSQLYPYYVKAHKVNLDPEN